MDLTIVAAFMLAALALSLVPGPDMAFIVANGIASGRRAGVVAALGMSLGLAVHTLAAALGLGALLQTAPAVVNVVRVVGAVLLLYMAYSAIKAARSLDADELGAQPRRSMRKTFALAAMTNLANPKVILFYVAFLPQFLTQGGWPATGQFLVLGGVFIVIGVLVDGAAGLAAGTLSEFLRRRRTVRVWLNRVSATIFGALAVRLLADSAS